MKNKLLKFFAFLYFFVFGNLLFARNVMAYIDPSVMTYAVQAIAGIAIALGTTFGILFRKAKKKINKKLLWKKMTNPELFNYFLSIYE